MHGRTIGFAALACAAAAVSAFGQTPPVTNGLVFWLHADSLSLANGQAVATWNDSSGYGNDATTNGTTFAAPTFVANAINGRPAVDFNGPAGQALYAGASPVLGSTNVTIFSVFRDRSTVFGSIVDLANPNTPSENYDQLFVPFPSSSWYFQWNNPTSGGFFNVNTAVSNSNTFVLRTDWHDGAGNVAMYYDGLNLASETNRPGLVTDAGNRLTIGHYQVGSTGYFDGQIAEILIYNTALSDSDRRWVANYLGDKYNLVVPEPTGLALSAAAIGLLGLRTRARRSRRD